VDYLSAAPEQELSAAQQPVFSRLTSLTLSCDGRSFEVRRPGPALWPWLGWVLPAAPQLQKLSVSSDTLFSGWLFALLFSLWIASDISTAARPSAAALLAPVSERCRVRRPLTFTT